VTQLQSTVLDQSRELAAWRSAALQGVNAASLMDSRSFLTSIGKLDPAAADFSDQLTAAVQAAVQTNPALRGTVVPPGQAGIGATGSTSAAENATPGLGRLRAAYGEK
jgi:hypothetical protein